MNYQEFKKKLMPSLDKSMAEIGFIREKTSMPIYWKYPNEDKRLAWVVCLNFSHRGNPLFDVLITPYWIPCQQNDEPFPRGVGYMGHLSPEGFDHGQHTWWTESEEQAKASIQELLDSLSGPGLEWFKQYSTPQQLFDKKPSAKLAADLGHLDEAKERYRNKLKSSFINLLLEKKTTHSTPFESVRDWEKERHERVIEDYSDVCQRLGIDMREFERDLSSIELEALRSEHEKYSEELSVDTRSRWLKSQVKYCENRINELCDTLGISTE